MLEASIARRWTLSELAEELHLAPGYLVRVFKAATGLPPMAYLAQVRAEHAAVMLLHSDEPITGIGRAVGWPDQNYFARRFKVHYGLSRDHLPQDVRYPGRPHAHRRTDPEQAIRAFGATGGSRRGADRANRGAAKAIER